MNVMCLRYLRTSLYVSCILFIATKTLLFLFNLSDIFATHRTDDKLLHLFIGPMTKISKPHLT